MAKKQNPNQVENVENVTTIPQPKKELNFKVIEENLNKWNFQEPTKTVFVGFYKRTDKFFDKVQNKEFELHVFEHYESGERVHIDSSHTIKKAIEKAISENFDFEKAVFMIEFLGKTILKGKPFNQFIISIAEL